MKALSAYNAFLKVLLPIFFLLFGTMLLFVMLREQFPLQYILSIGAFIAGSYWIRNIYFTTCNFYFDATSLILKSKQLERKIDLGQVAKIKLTLGEMRIMGLEYYQYIIVFKNESGNPETLSFYVSNLNSELWDFQDLVKKAAPNAQIENHDRSWEK